MRTTEDLARADRQHIWHPFTQQQGWAEEEPPLVIDHADGTTLFDTDGNAYIDGVSSLWCNVHGHRHPALDEAIRRQLDRVAHSTMLGLSHEPAIELAERLVAIAPPGLTRVFYSDSGSTAVEVVAEDGVPVVGPAGRAAAHASSSAWRTPTTATRSGRCRSAVSTCSTRVYRPLLFDTIAARAGDAEHLASLLAEHGETVAAVIVEPLVQGAAGMLMQPDGYLRRVRELCDEHGVLLICDEVATGFGRTGRMFACEHEDVVPDLLCVGKGITGGYLPLAATLTTERLYEGFLGRHEDYRSFFHGHTYTGNPLGCAAGIATLETFEHERTIEQLAPKIELLTRLLEREIVPLPGVAEVRQRGFMVGIELAERPASDRAGHRGDARRASARRDHPPARRRRGADAAARDHGVGAAAARGDHGRGDRRRELAGSPRGGLSRPLSARQRRSGRIQSPPPESSTLSATCWPPDWWYVTSTWSPTVTPSNTPRWGRRRTSLADRSDRR